MRRRGLLPVLLFLLAAAGTGWLGVRILASERASAERTARERLRACAREAAGILAAEAARLLGRPPDQAVLPAADREPRGEATFLDPPAPRPFPRLAAAPGRDAQADFFLAQAEVVEAVDGDPDGAAPLYAAAASEGRDGRARLLALFRLAALERRRGNGEAAEAREREFLALLPEDGRDTLEAAVVGARAKPPDADLVPLLLAAVGSPDEPIALGLLADAGLEAREALARRRAAIALQEALRPLLARAAAERWPAEGAVPWGGTLVAWREAGPGTGYRVAPLPPLPAGAGVRAPEGHGLVESVLLDAPFLDSRVVASMPLAEVEAEARRGAWLLGGALAALLLAGGAASVLSVRAARREAEAARARAAFVTKVGHDLRTPLAVVRMYAETLAAGKVADPAEAREFAAVAAREAERLSGMVGRVLDLSRLSEGDGALARRPLDLAALAAEVAEVHRPLLGRAGLRLEVRAPGPLPVLGDSAALRGAVSNLLENAGSHAASGGSVEVEGSREGRMAVLRVLDRGPGLPAGTEERLFERFVRGPGAAGPGAGLGLALVREAALAHGGTARASNREGGGAAFEVRVPLAGEAP